MNLTLDDFQTLAKEEEKQFSKVEAPVIEGQVLQFYRLTALASKKEMELEEIAHLWMIMVKVCDAACTKIANLNSELSDNQISYDRMLDLRSKCQNLVDLHS